MRAPASFRSSIQGPVPMQASDFFRSPYCSTTSFAMMHIDGVASASSSHAYGSLRLNLTV
jgi:hypothetical protein